MNLHKPKALHRFSERGLAGRERENAGERTNAEGGCEAHACMLRKGADVLNATSIRHVLNARSVEHIGVCSTRLRAEWVRNRRGGKANSACVRHEDSFWRTGDRQACLKRLCQARNDV